MSAPPTDIPASALFEALCAMPRPFQIVDFPRKDPVTGADVGQIHMQVLTQQERMGAMGEAEKVTRQILKEDLPTTGQQSQGYDDIRNNEVSLQILVRACRRVEDPSKQFFPNAAAARKALTGDEVGVLMSLYLITQAQRGPIISQMHPEDVDAWVKRLAEGASRDPLGLLSLDGLMDLVMLLASRLYQSQTGTTSSSSPVGSTVPESDDEFPRSTDEAFGEG